MIVGASSRTSAEHVPAEAPFVGRGVAGLEDAAVDAAAEVLDEGAEQARIGLADRGIAVERHMGVAHREILRR